MSTSNDDATADLLAWLSHASSYPEPTESVERIETHISWVFLTDHRVYKLKKPVKFDFLDFSTLTARHRMCLTEVRLNQRLAPRVYRRAVPISRQANGGFAFDSFEHVVDWVVVMRRLDDRVRLDHLIESGHWRQHDVRSFARRLVAFYKAAAPVLLQADDYRTRVEQHVRDNLRELLAPQHELPANLVARVHERQLRLIGWFPQLLDDRARDGRVIEGHGDLRPEHIYLEPVPVAIDCLEFNEELRTLDVADEIAFLWMECERLGAAEVGEAVYRTYAERSTDHVPRELLDFYMSYRACVRAKVAALRAAQLENDQRETALKEARSYLHLADAHPPQLGPPVLVIVSGLSGTGKSTLAAAAGETWGIEHLQTDAIRQQMFGNSQQPAGASHDRYTPENRRAVYQVMLKRAGPVLDAGRSVIVDGTFLGSDELQAAQQVAQRYDAQPLLARCICPPQVARQRIAQRAAAGSSLSEADERVFHTQQQQQPAAIPSELPASEIDTAQSLAGQLDALREQLAELVRQ